MVKKSAAIFQAQVNRMVIEHIAIYTDRLEELRDFYIRWFGARANDKYHNPTTGLESYFLSFDSGARLELMRKPALQQTIDHALRKGITHIAFSVETRQHVDQLAAAFQAAGQTIKRGPRTTGDGYYEFEIDDPDGNHLEVTAIR